MAGKLEFAAKHLANLTDFYYGRLTTTQMKEGADLLYGLTNCCRPDTFKQSDKAWPNGCAPLSTAVVARSFGSSKAAASLIP